MALQDVTAAQVANAIIDDWIMKFGAPDVIHTDQGSNVNSELIYYICRIFLIEKTRTTPCHPRENGQVERFNRVVADTLSNYFAEKPHGWDVYLLYNTFVYNTTVSQTIGVTPYFMIFVVSAIPYRFVCPGTPERPETKVRRERRRVEETPIRNP